MPNAPRHAWTPHAYTIDALRIAAATAVAVFHLTWRGTLLPGAYPIGWIGVQVFFVISGAVILGSAQGRTAGAFLAGRMRRLYPAALACCALNLIAIAALHPWFAIPAVYATATPVRILGSVTLLGERFLATAYWTLPIELAFYATVAALRMARRPRWAWVAAALVLTGLVWQAHARLPAPFGAALTEYVPVWLIQGVLPRYAPYFGLGMMLFLAAQGPVGRGGWAVVALAVALTAGEMQLRLASDIAVNYQGNANLAAMLPIAMAAWGTACVLVWTGFRGHGPALPPALARPLRLAGLATYPFYLLHEALAGGTMGALVAHGVPPLPAMVAGLAACGAASAAVVVLWERPLSRWFASPYFPWRLFGATMIANTDASASSSPLPTNSTSSATPVFPAFSIRSSTP